MNRPQMISSAQLSFLNACGRFGLLISATLLSGCMIMQPTVAPDLPIQKSSGYIAAEFTRTTAQVDIGMAVILQNVDTKAEYAMRLGSIPMYKSEVRDQVLAIEVPPGRYVASGWETMGQRGPDRHEIGTSELSKPFDVRAGEIVVLGDFAVRSARTSYSTARASWSSNAFSQSEMHAALEKAYPAFRDRPVTCLLCEDDRVDAERRDTGARWAKLPNPPSETPLPTVNPSTTPAANIVQHGPVAVGPAPAPPELANGGASGTSQRLIGQSFDRLTDRLSRFDATTPSGRTLRIVLNDGSITVDNLTNGMHGVGSYWVDKTNSRFCISNMSSGFRQMSVCYEADMIDGQTAKLQSQSGSYHLMVQGAAVSPLASARHGKPRVNFDGARIR